KPGIFRYISQLPPSTSALEMFVYADNAQVKVNGGTSTKVELPSSNTNVNITLTRNLISGFPTEAFSSTYAFNFIKNANYRVYWNPQSQCKQGCDGSEPATAFGDFATVLEIAKATGREINMVGGVWNVTDNFTEGVVPWKVGFELVGYVGNIWDLKSENDLPSINLENVEHIEVEGRSPRRFVGLNIMNGYNVDNGGAVKVLSQKIYLKNVLISSSKSEGDGGGLYVIDTLNAEYVRFSNNLANGNGGAIAISGNINMLNVLFLNNISLKNGGAVEMRNAEMYVGNAIFYDNHAGLVGGAMYNENSSLSMWNATFFSNSATVANGALGGDANGMIGNSIFWKNIVSDCNTENCSSEIPFGYLAVNSSFSQDYVGKNIHVGDPKFADEEKPEGESMYMDYDAGLNLSLNSPLLNYGEKSDYMPKNDLLGELRESEHVALGAYAYAMPSDDVFIGLLDSDGNVVSAKPAIPLINAVSGGYYREFLANSQYARVLKASVRKHEKTRKEKARVKLWVKNFEGEVYTDIPPVEFDVFRNGEENGRYVFQTMTANAGKPIFFSKRPQDAGNFDEGIVICMKSVTDYFYYEAE
ncbi:MAG: hypothetical protein IK012_05285, partial [Fibrobacter sp.]|uniref:hypothetical protein n=1 Tax=Fibrobacter sp. TaxID=35828 RepID=UPI0025BCC114